MRWKKPDNRRGYTLIEMLTVAAIIAVLASLVVGRLKNDQNGNDFQRGIQSIESAANKAKNKAITTGKTWELTFDSNTQSLKASQVEDDSSSTTNSRSNSNDSTGNEQASDGKLGTGWSVGTVRGSDGTSESDLHISFYPDGTADAKSAEFKSGDATVSLKVKSNGTIEVNRGELGEEEPTQEWEAGNIEVRSGQ